MSSATIGKNFVLIDRHLSEWNTVYTTTTTTTTVNN